MEPATAAEERRFGKYTLVAKLATGGMAEIFLARLHGDGGFEKLVCIKRILPHLAKDPQFVSMFLDEARVAARISHPNVCQVFELGEWQRQYYIAMEYLEGVPLSVFRRKDFYATPPDPRLVAGFGVQACEGLHHAHQLKRPDGELLGVVHRDMSPQNLFATTDGVVKVLDFGIAKVQDANSRTSTGAVKGTYAYMAPEQLRNEKIDRRVDVWAIGVVMWETLAQTHLFKRDTEFLTFEAITKDPIPNICDVRPDVPPLLGDTISRALSRNADDRFPSARALGEAFAQAVGPLGGPMTQAGISEEVAQSFEVALAEQRTLLRMAREGGQFDLESSSPLVGHGTRLSTPTPVSNIQRRAHEAAEEVANFVAASAAIDSLESDDANSDGRPHRRFGTDGAFTPAPSRGTRSQAYETPEYDVEDGVIEEEQDQYSSRPHGRRSSSGQPVQRRSSGQPIQQRRSSPVPVQRRSQPYAVAPAEWRYDETEPPPEQPRRPSMPTVPAKTSRLPWIVAIISVLIAGATGVMLYLKLVAGSKSPPKVAVAATTGSDATPAKVEPPPVVEKAEPAAIPDAAVAVAEPTVAEPTVAEPTVAEPTVPQTTEPEVVAKTTKTTKKTTKTTKKVETPKVETPKVETPKVEVKATAGGPPGFITIDSAPVYAVIYIDGKKLGETPQVNIKLAPGKHQVRAVSPSGATKNFSIQIESGKTARPAKISW
jgi:serine/threonine protein kinase